MVSEFYVCRKDAGSCAGVAVRVSVTQAGRVDPGVDLRRRDRGMAEQLLNRTQICATLKQMSCKGMPKRVRRDSADAGNVRDPYAQPPRHIGVGKAPAALREEERFLTRIARQRTPASLQIA